VPTTPHSRYAAVFTTAVVGAGMVALAAGATFDDAKLDQNRLAAFGDLDGTLEDRVEAAERSSRAERRSEGLASSVTQAPDLWLLPLTDYTFTSEFGPRWGRSHNGVDLAAPQGTPVFTMKGGTVSTARYNGGYGNLVVVDHGDGTETYYGHNSQLIVTEGQEVEAGDVIALVGNTGFSFGAHVHLEVHVDGTPVDPVAFFIERGVDILGKTDPLYASS
jgi:murein DD-endopeptidase MepM/ murein hydrolase activator NlpD